MQPVRVKAQIRHPRSPAQVITHLPSPCSRRSLKAGTAGSGLTGGLQQPGDIEPD